MKTEFSYIRNRISEYDKDSLFDYCYRELDRNREKISPIWYIFTIIKWTIIYGGRKYPIKELTPQKFRKLYADVSNLNEEHITYFLKEKRADKAFQILHNQQFYLQKRVHKNIYATQLKLFSSIKGKYDIEKSFLEKTGIKILNFLYIQQLIWLYINIGKLNKEGLFFNGFLDNQFWNLVSEMTSIENVKSFINLLTLNPNNAEESISKFKHKINKTDLQTMEMSFFTLFPFTIWKNQIKLVHPSIFNHTINYYIYDFLKANDQNFTTDFGNRFEKYIELGLKEIQIEYKTENHLKNILPSKSNLTDFFLENENIFIECKAIEMQALPSVIPTDEFIYNALKDSLFKAYFNQLVTVSKYLNPAEENWGIIITYKEIFWSDFTKLFEIGKDKYPSENFDHIPPQNVFIIDIYTWDLIIQIVKDKKATLSEILKKAKFNNSKPETSKQLFSMQIDDYEIENLNLSYLKNEIAILNLSKYQ